MPTETDQPITETPTTPATPARRSVTPRAVVLGLLAAVLLVAVTPYNDYKIGATFLAGHQFPVGAIFALLLLAAPVNAALRRFAPRFVFARGELLTVWILILVASGLPSSGLLRFLLPHVAAPQYFSNGVNSWEERVWYALPEPLLLSDREAAKQYYTGLPPGGAGIPWGAWAVPMAAWGLFALCFFVATFCAGNLLRRQWVENEKFTFPLVSLPLLLTEDPAPGRLLPDVLRHPLVWVGVGLTTALHALNGLHQLYPAIPGLPTTINLEEYLTAPPWNRLGRLPLQFYPLVIGLSYLLSAEVAFSLWFFFLFYKAELLVGVVYNFDLANSFGSPAERQFHALQGFGGALALVCWTLWAARTHLRDVWEKATGGPRAAQIDDSGEMISYRASLAGLAAAYLGMALWLNAATVPPLLIGVSLLLITLSFVTISWAVTQAGTLFMVMPCMAVDVVGGVFGTQVTQPGAWYMTQRVECIFYRDTRELLLPEVLGGAKAAEAGDIPLRPLFRGMVLSVCVAVGVAFFASLWVPYANGGANVLPGAWTFRSGPQRPLQLAGNLATAPLPGSPWNLLHAGGGFAGVLGLLLLRARLGFGLHPIGFISASTFSGWTLWYSVFLGWFAKSLVLRFGGMKGYRAALPFFTGLIFGDALNALLWIVLGSLTGTGYILLPAN